MNPSYSPRIDRRRFLRGAAASAVLFPILPGAALAADRGLSAHEKVNVAGIGVGSQGGSDLAAVAGEGHNVVALCDVDSEYAAKTFAQYPKARQFKDYRVMLDAMKGEIDAVVIGTPDHTHAVIALEAMRRGKHVYCEKPLAHTVHEVRLLMAAARESKVVTQLGNQGHSSGSIRRLCEWVGAGAIGRVHTVHASCDAFKEVYCQLRNLDKLGQAYEVPKSLDYDLWIGPVTFRPYTPFWVHWNWRGWMPFGTGTIGDWYCHVMDPTFWALDLDAPSTVVAEVTDYDPAKHGLTYPPACKITFEFPARGGRGPVKVVWHDGNNRMPRPEALAADDQVPGTGAILIGEKGLILHGSHGGGGCRLLPEPLMDQYTGKNAPPEKLPRVKNHAWDWIDAIRNGRQAGSHFGYGGPLTQAALLGAIAIRFPGQTLKWDDAQARFTNHDEANAHLRPALRPGWSL
ncbi:MAG TPA: Gfo/Idh/MocA family oxidoreductase [Verrucomicrobiota bacterium]|nr:Gfo/Idh/MocA family oxidoreductase [Verrucomicrobiota bacterium]HNU53331.1 Gfo/Idh/MocA family oxidoreductase [Verrucomicrobiota bacterium]